MRGIRKQSSDTQSSSQPKEKRRLDTKQKKGMLIGGGIFLVAVIALILVKNLTGGGGADGENVLYADSVGMITGTGLGTQNRFTGVVEAQDTLKLTLADNQKVKQIFVEKGQEVEPGTKLFEYDTEELAMTLDQGKLELEKITNNISSLNSQIATLTTEKKSAPASEQLSYTTQIQELQMEIKQEEYNYKVKELEVNRTQKSLEQSTVTSTVAGIVQEINEQQGTDPSTGGYDDATGEKKPFMSILSTGKYRIKGKISEQNIGDLTPGTQVTIRSRVNEDEIWTGTVDNVDTEKPENSSQDSMSYGSENSDNQATKYPFYVTLDTVDGLMLGQHVYIETSTSLEADKMWLMRDYIVDADSDHPYVWVAGDNDKLEKRSVTLGETNEDMGTCEIVDGLKASDYIVWPSEECKKGAAVVKNDSGTSGSTSGSTSDMSGAEGGYEEPVEENAMQEGVPGTEESADE